MKDASQDLLAWDQSLQDAIRSRQGENVSRLVETRIDGTLRSGGSGDAVRNLAEVLERNLALAARVRDSIRSEIIELGRQRLCAGGGATVDSRPSRSFVA